MRMRTLPNCLMPPWSSGRHDAADAGYPPLNPFQLLQAADHGRHRYIRKAALPVGDADLADIDVALRIQRNAVRREELADLKARTILATEPRDTLALGVDDGQARTQIRRLAIDR